MTDSRQLLAEYARTGSESAFQELVERYIHFVHSAAIRLADGDAHLAEDICQIVFADLARAAGTLSRRVMIGGWLHRHTVYVARSALRSQRRRHAREKIAAEMNSANESSAENWRSVAPMLDDAINRLNATERALIILRFFEQRDFQSLGQAFGIKEDAARMRLQRALNRLRVLLQKQGITLSAAALAAHLAKESVQAASLGFAANISASAIASAAARGAGAATLFKIMTATKLKTAAASALLLGAVLAPLIIRQRAERRLDETTRAFEHQLRLLRAQSRDDSNRLARAAAAQAFSQEQLEELMRLRSEAGRLRTAEKELQSLRAKYQQATRAVASSDAGLSSQSPLFTPLPKSQWKFAGYATPEAALESMVWAASKGNGKTLLETFAPEAAQEMLKEAQGQGKSLDDLAREMARDFGGWNALWIGKKKIAEDGDVTFTIQQEETDASSASPRKFRSETNLKFRNIGGQWKFVGD